ncbi:PLASMODESMATA CALLOSE-BINDING PROTEIN 3-like [Chenopodium quinoa]|uniref:X8 domain-containing protein n=1 Tax=Chenopodium quinoa TaxID=63459 RepID=A0A803LZC7_CHEQI|nr:PLASMODESMATA CALLOSE-BINDING PROTEIN 3-like [Chenopodium quinoa]
MEMDRQVKQRQRRLVLVMVVLVMMIQVAEGVWCVARSGADDDALQSALDYACAAGADCGPIQQSGLCFLPNTLQAHASYAFNSFYQRNHMAATSCQFSATATLAKTDPSYGSCVYPSSPSTAGSITSNTTGATPTTNPYGTATPFSPTTMSPTTFGGGAGTGLNPNYMGPPISTTNESKAPIKSPLPLLETLLVVLLLSLAIY